MNSLNKIVESKIISIKQQKIIIDKDVAQIYGVIYLNLQKKSMIL